MRKLRQVLHAISQTGMRSALLWVGNGLHVQAARETGLHDTDFWLDAMHHIVRAVGLNDVGSLLSGEPLVWDRLVKRATELQSDSRSAEQKLRRLLLDQLIIIEEERRSLPLYGRLLDSCFENILSFNIDRILVRHSLRGNCEATDSGKLSEYDQIPVGAGLSTRIWYPYGHTRAESSMRLGTTDHSFRLMDLEQVRSSVMHDWVESRGLSRPSSGAKSYTNLRTPNQFYTRARLNPRGWHGLAFAAPVIIVGCRLPLEDWPIWWFCIRVRGLCRCFFRKK
jgi:hypothetical protein